MRTFVVILSVLAVSYSLTDREVCQQVVNGIFAQNNLAAPRTLLGCFSDPSLSTVVKTLGTVLNKAAAGTLLDLWSLSSSLKSLDGFTATERSCALQNAELRGLLPLYGLDPSAINPAAARKKLTSYVMFNYPSFNSLVRDCNTAWNVGKRYDTGYKAADFLHRILGTKAAKAGASAGRKIGK